MANSKKWFK